MSRQVELTEDERSFLVYALQYKAERDQLSAVQFICHEEGDKRLAFTFKEQASRLLELAARIEEAVSIKLEVE